MNAELLTQLAEKAANDKKGLVLLKNAAVRLQQFEFASQLREIERKNFPESQEQKDAKKQGDELLTLFSMVGLKPSPQTAWLIVETVKLYNRKKDKFDLKDASKLLAKAEEYFGEE